ncbi:IS1341-type transposase [Natronococcus amylolyticus DSM 10524]|uniref:IS1341-type transposase n=1 Tax=Natronococcus amylolyticus DSM 10524 TaxID=1227497 RepID=L9X102_9EURY|nr:RNA-guided endonuclease TnpB family protein [Natronococcus amylolyticus]ELY55400.1 IS1341-type transposase [Natronococcus amylolyticus DSM 10524]
MVEEAFKYAAEPEDTTTAKSAWSAIQTCREVYNHALTQEYKPAPDYDKPSYTAMQNKLPQWKREWSEWSSVYSKCLQMAVRRIKHSETILGKLKERGFDVGELKWKSPRDYRSITYNQSGFDVDSHTGRTNHATVELSKIGTFHLTFHRPLPDDADIKEVILKKQKTGDWTVSIMVEYGADYPENPTVEDIDVEDTVGIDLGITTFIHDSDGRAFKPLDEEDDRERIEKRHQAVSRKEHESNNWNKARQRLARAYERLSNKRKAYREALANAYTKRYDAVFLEDLNVGSMMQQNGNSRNIASMSWYETLQTFQRLGEKNGCHVVLVPPEGTTKRCVQCGCESGKPLWVREHSCPSCGFTTDRDQNAALEVQRLGLLELGVVEDESGLGQELAESTPAETGTAAGSRSSSFRDVIPASAVVDTGSPTLKERAAVAASE